MVDRKTAYLTFGTPIGLSNFLRRKINPVVGNNIEYCVMEKFRNNRILFTAEHAQTARISIKNLGPKAYAGIGDKNTDLLAKIGSYYLHSAYLMPLFVRTEADASRPPKDLGKGLRLCVRLTFSKQKIICLPIHSNPSMLPYLNHYHKTIEKINPKKIISVHGISIKREFDMLFGFGQDYSCIGGKKEAFKFKSNFINYLNSVFRQLNIRKDLKIGISTWRFTGSKNYVLSKHISDYNKKKAQNEQRIGMQVEMNLRGRVTKKSDDILTIPYQIAIQALGDFVSKWKSN